MVRCACGATLTRFTGRCFRCGAAAAATASAPVPSVPRTLLRCAGCGGILVAGAVRCLRCRSEVAHPASQEAEHGDSDRSARVEQSVSRQEERGPLALTHYYEGDELVDTLTEPSDDEVEHWLNAVRLSSPVASNADYRELASKTVIRYLRDQGELNAYAMHSDGAAPSIQITGGIVRAYVLTAVAAALAEEDTEGDSRVFAEHFTPRFRLVADHIHQCGRELASGDGAPSTVFHAERVGVHDVMQRARSHLTGMMLNLIAHEMGHIVLRHTSSVPTPGGSPAALAMEHQADAFARSVCESVPFQQQVTFAGFLDAVLWPWISEPSQRPTTHPGARSRLLRFVDENVELERLGITPERLVHFLPPG